MNGMYTIILESIYGVGIEKKPGNEAARSATATEFWRRKKIFQRTLDNNRQISDDQRDQFKNGLVAHITKDKPGRQITRSELTKAGELRNNLKSTILSKKDKQHDNTTDITNIQPNRQGSLISEYKNHRMPGGLYDKAKNNNKGSLLNTVA